MKLLAYHRRGEDYRRLIGERFPELDITAGFDDEVLLREAIVDAEILLTFQLPLAPLAHARRLRWLQLTSAGADHLLPAREHLAGVVVTSARGVHCELMADYTFGMLVMLQWGMPRLLAQQRARVWQQQATEPLAGKILGVVGLGAIGGEIARRGYAFGMTVLGVKRHPDPVPGVERIYGPDRLREMLPACDAVVLVMPGTAETDRMIGEAELRLMKPTAYLVNVARGRVVDEAALVRALAEGRLAGAALDVFEQEPLPPESPLWAMDNVIVTPHISGEPTRYVEGVVEVFTRNYRRFVAGLPLEHMVHLERGY